MLLSYRQVSAIPKLAYEIHSFIEEPVKDFRKPKPAQVWLNQRCCGIILTSFQQSV